MGGLWPSTNLSRSEISPISAENPPWVKDIPPYVIAAGDRATLHGLNNVGLKRHNFGKHTISQLKKAYRIFFRIGLTVAQAQERAKAELEQLPEVTNFATFIRESNRGVTR